MSPDITMCSNEDCPKKLDCYRFTAPPDQYWQSYCKFELKDGECEYFIKNKE